MKKINYQNFILIFTPILLIFFWVLNKDYNFYPDYHKKYINFLIAFDFIDLFFFNKELIFCADESIKFLNECSNFLLISKISRLLYVMGIYIIFLVTFLYLYIFYFNSKSISEASNDYIQRMSTGVFLSLTFPSLFYFLTDTTNEVIVYYLFFLSLIFYKTYIFFILCFLSYLIDDNNTKIIILFFFFERFFYFLNLKTDNRVYFFALLFFLMGCFLHSTTIIYFIDSIYFDRKIFDILAGFVLLNQDLPLIGRLIYFFVSLFYYDPIKHTTNYYFLFSIILIFVTLLLMNLKKIYQKLIFYLKINIGKNNILCLDNFYLHLLICSIIFILSMISILPTHAFAKYFLYIFPIFFTFLNVFYDKSKILLINLLLVFMFIYTF